MTALPIPDRAFLKSLFRFALVGGGVTLAVYLLFAALIDAGVDTRVAGTAGWALGLGIGYVLNKRFTFELKDGATLREVGTFIGGYGLQLGLGLAGYTVLMDGLHLSKEIAFVLVTGSTAVFSFLFMRFAVFRRPTDGAA